MLPNNILALLLTFGLALAWLRLVDAAAHKGWIESSLSRKIIHIGTGPIFVLCWLFFKDTPDARYLAALVPLAITLQFLLVGLGFIKDQSAVDAMSRTGKRSEILRGPLYYGIVFVLLTVLFWKDNPAGMIALMFLCGGDGLADIVGKGFDSPHIPWSPRKTWAGSLAVFFGGWILASAILLIMLNAGVFPGRFQDYIVGLTVIAAAATLVESLPFSDIDNLTVPLTAVLLGIVLF